MKFDNEKQYSYNSELFGKKVRDGSESINYKTSLIMKNAVLKIKKWLPLLGLLFLQAFMQKVQAQCSPAFTGSPCVNAPIQFNANSPGTISWLWDFGDGSTSNSRDPVYLYTAPGSYTVTFTGSGSVNCNKTLTVVVKPSPTINVKRLSFKDQCFEGNNFCFFDSSSAVAGSRIVRITYVFSDGGFHEEIDPTFPRGFCHTVVDPRGGVFDLAVEAEDLNGCISRYVMPAVMVVWPKLGVEIISDAPTGCDSTQATITNMTYVNWKKDPERFIGLKDVGSFVFDYGDGTVITGDSVTNTEFWTGFAGNGQHKYMYRKNGTFDATLRVTSRFGCSETYTFKAAATNIMIRPEIISKTPICAAENPVEFSVAEEFIGARVNWNFGDPPSGNDNFDDKSWKPTHNYGSGPWMISLRVRLGPCDVMAYDTIQKVGPASIIEKPFVRVLEKEKYQCTIRDSVHFVNNSVFYISDANIYDEDSFALVWDLDTFGFYFDTIRMKDGNICRIDTPAYTNKINIRKVLAFNYVPAPKGPGVGNQTTKSGPQHLAGRHNEYIYRLWTLGDNYAPQCTTDYRANKNVGRNCNFTMDTLPVHWYRPWDEIYKEENNGNFYKQAARKTLFNKAARKCYIVSVFPADTIVIPADTLLTVPFGKTLTYAGHYIDSFSKFPERNYDTLKTYDTIYNDTLNASTCSRDTFYLRTDTIKTIRFFRVKRPPAFYASRADTIQDVKVTVIYDTIAWNIKLRYVLCNLNTDSVQIWDSIPILNVKSVRRDTTIIYKDVPLTWTATYDDEDIFIPAGVSLFIKSIQTGLSRIVKGPKIETLKKNEQFELKLGDTLYPRPKVTLRKVDTTYATPSIVFKDTIINGIDSFIVANETYVDAEYHRDFFFKTIAQCNSVSLYQIDTFHLIKDKKEDPPPYCESTDQISLALIPPNARGLEWTGGTPCPLSGGRLDYYLTFDMAETKPGCTQQWFEVNYDSMANPNGWVPYNSGGVLAPPPPGSPIPFVFPYQIVGAWGTKFVKGYPPGQISKNRAKGSFTIGLIVGNGPPQSKKILNPGTPPPDSITVPAPPECMDTAWYTDMFRIMYLNGGFEILRPPGEPKYICAGDYTYFRILDPIQDSMSSLSWNYGYNNDPGRISMYAEEFKYYQPYKGPKGEKWLRNYVIRYEIDDVRGQKLLDTITTAIIREWTVGVNTDQADREVKDAFKALNLDLRDIPKDLVAYYLGDGTFGCIDTTGIGDLFRFGYSGYADNDTATFIRKDVCVGTNCERKTQYRYKFSTNDTKANARYDTIIPIYFNKYKLDTSYSYITGPCKIDTIMEFDTISITRDSTMRRARIIEEVLHFRDSSIQGYDTLFIYNDPKDSTDVDTIPGLYKKIYRHRVLVQDPCDPNKIDTAWQKSNGLMVPRLALKNTVGCENVVSQYLNVGFLNLFRMRDSAVCEGTTVFLEDSIRYWLYKDDLNPDYPVDIRAFWENPARYSKNIETKEVDWDVRDANGNIDTMFQFERSIKFSHNYDQPGEYLITIAMKDSVGCRDTAQIRTYVTGVKAGFESSSNSNQCKQIVQFFDTSVVYDPCKLRDTCKTYNPCDIIKKYEWDFGDGTRTSVLKDPSHNYTRGGWYRVVLRVWTELGCQDSIADSIFIFGPRPAFEFVKSAWGPDSIIICVNDSISVKNWSVPNPDFYNADWVFFWGDSSFNNTSNTKDVNIIAGHRYPYVGVYYLTLSQTDSITGTALRCSNVFPEVNPDLLVQRKIKVIVLPIAQADFDISDSVVCPDEEIVFTDKSDPLYTRYQWYFGDGDSTLKQDPDSSVTHSYPTQGTYTIRLVPDYDVVGFVPKCVDTATRTVRVVDVKADFLIDSLNEPEFKFRNQSTGAVKYIWSLQKEIDGILQEVSREINTVYNWGELVGTFQVCLYAESAEGCLDTICKPIDNNFVALIIPYNVFTPAADKNGDGFNDLYLVSVKGHEEFEIKIFNRWGELVFETKDPLVGWDGTVMNKGKKECPAGAYFYIIDYKLKNRPKNDGKEPISGSITLIRDK
jgi:gliding motility-associated-like protein